MLRRRLFSPYLPRRACLSRRACRGEHAAVSQRSPGCAVSCRFLLGCWALGFCGSRGDPTLRGLVPAIDVGRTWPRSVVREQASLLHMDLCPLGRHHFTIIVLLSQKRLPRPVPCCRRNNMSQVCHVVYSIQKNIRLVNGWSTWFQWSKNWFLICSITVWSSIPPGNVMCSSTPNCGPVGTAGRSRKPFQARRKKHQHVGLANLESKQLSVIWAGHDSIYMDRSPPKKHVNDVY